MKMKSLRHSEQNPNHNGGCNQGPKLFPWRQAAMMGALTVALGATGVALAENASSTTNPVARAEVVAQKLGPVILIDPGHGGTNSGAPSIRPDLFEKHITLAMAESLRDELEGMGFDVRLTRTRDIYLTLQERGRIANEMDADLFVSLHANASESHSHSGYETFILTPDAIDIDTRALRQHSGRVRNGVTPDTAALLDDIERSTTQLPAAKLAAAIQDNMRTLRGKAGDRGVRQDSMHVLLGATMPAILVEVGFIDHPVEGEELMEAELRDEIVHAIAQAIDTHSQALAER